MKTSVQIAKETELEVDFIRNMINRNGIRGNYDQMKQKMFYNDHQVELIHNILYLECRIDYIILESKINKRNEP